MTEKLLREVNRRIYQLTRDFDGPTEFLCECGHPSCRMTSLEVFATEFADILATPGCLLVAPGHETPGVEIVRARRGYLIVRAPDVAIDRPPDHATGDAVGAGRSERASQP